MIQSSSVSPAAAVTYLVPTDMRERREDTRHRKVYRVAHVEAGNDQGLARVRNISDHGIGLELYMPVQLGDRLTIHLGEGITVAGDVVWSCNADCGVQLEDPINSAALLQDLGTKSRSNAIRPLRVPVATTGFARSEKGICAIDIKDVSQRGMKIGHDGSFCTGLRVKVSLASGAERDGVVRWSQDGIAGIMLLEPFSPMELGSALGL